MRTLTALGEVVIVEAPTQGKEKTTESGIILQASNDKETTNQGVVVAVGEKVEGISVGDMCIISRTGVGEVFMFNDKFHLALPKNEVYAVIKENKGEI